MVQKLTRSQYRTPPPQSKQLSAAPTPPLQRCHQSQPAEAQQPLGAALSRVSPCSQLWMTSTVHELACSQYRTPPPHSQQLSAAPTPPLQRCQHQAAKAQQPLVTAHLPTRSEHLAQAPHLPARNHLHARPQLHVQCSQAQLPLSQQQNRLPSKCRRLASLAASHPRLAPSALAQWSVALLCHRRQTARATETSSRLHPLSKAEQLRCDCCHAPRRLPMNDSPPADAQQPHTSTSAVSREHAYGWRTCHGGAGDACQCTSSPQN